MKLPKLPWWGWLLALYCAVPVAVKLGWWKPKGVGVTHLLAVVFFPVIWVMRLFDSKPGNQPPPAFSLRVATDADYAARPLSWQDKYKTYLATTPSDPALDFDAWMQLQTGEAEDRGAAQTNVN